MVAAMCVTRSILALLLIVGAGVSSGAALVHAHDGLGPGLYNTECPLAELGGHSAALPLAGPAPARLEVTAVRLSAGSDNESGSTVPLPDTPRAPPFS